MTNKILILITVGQKKECRKIARYLVGGQLAACVNIAGPIESIYRWKGKVARDREYQLFIKTTREMFPEILLAVSRLHSYENPEVICLPVIDGSEKYLQWLDGSLKKGSSTAKNIPARGSGAM